MVLYRMHQDVCGRANLANLESRRIRFSPRVEFASEWIHPRTCVPALTPRGPLLIAHKASPCSLCTQTAHASHAACRTYRPTVLGTGYGFESTGQKRCDDDWPIIITSPGSHQSAQRSTRAALCSARCIRPNQAALDRRIVRHGDSLRRWPDARAGRPHRPLRSPLPALSRVTATRPTGQARSAAREQCAA